MKKIILILLVFLISCMDNNHLRDEKPIEINLETKEVTEEHAKINNDAPIFVAISTMISPKETFKQYEKLLEYLSGKLGREIKLKQRKTYNEVNNMLESGELDFAFICTGAYKVAKEKFGVNILVVPVVDGEPYYQAYLIANKNSSINSLDDLKDRTFAFTDPLSNTGYMYAKRLLEKKGYAPESFFKKTIFTFAHDYSIQAVARGIVDGASVDGLIYNYLAKYYPERISNIKIFKKSQKFSIPPFVFPDDADKELIGKIRNILIAMHEDKTGKEILDKLLIDKFIYPKNYDISNIE